MTRFTGIFLCMFTLLPLSFTYAQGFYDMNTVQTIEINFSQLNWDYMMDTSKQGAEGYIVAEWIKINGTQIDSVGVRYKGNSSYSVNKVKNPLHIELDHYLPDNQYEGYTDIKLGNAFKDPTFVREVLTYKIARNYMPAPLSNYAKLYINGTYIGLYSNTESITKKFVDKHFYSNDNAFFKCNPVYSTGAKSNLAYLGSDSTLYFNGYEIKSDYGWNDLMLLCNTLKNDFPNIQSVFDVDRALWMLAIDNLFVNLDSYIGGICQNYYLYRSSNGSFNTILWDLNEAFGCFNNSGEGGPMNMTQMQQMSVWLHQSNTNWPLIQKLLNNPLYKRMYIAHYRTLYNEFFAADSYLAMADTLRTLIDADVQADINKMYTYTQFQNGMTTSITTGMLVPGIKLLMDGRKSYLTGTAEFQYQEPQIGMPFLSDTLPQINDSIIVSVQIQNAQMVNLGYRHDKADRFVRIPMFDDGQHGDGTAADGTFGATLPIASSQTQFYIYSENANAGRFLPERAEYEFFTVNADIQQVLSGQLVINELMAMNSATITDAQNQYSDWIELYNTTSDTLNLNLLYLSDNFNIPYKWQFPANQKITPFGYLLVWANDDTTGAGLNAPFKLSGSGEKIILSYDNGVVIDSVSFSQQTTDISYGRYPNGTGAFQVMPPTPMASNIVSEIEEHSFMSGITVYPNPANNILNISATEPICSIYLYGIGGNIIFATEGINENNTLINLPLLPKGMYFIKVNGLYNFKVIKN